MVAGEAGGRVGVPLPAPTPRPPVQQKAPGSGCPGSSFAGHQSPGWGQEPPLMVQAPGGAEQAGPRLAQEGAGSSGWGSMSTVADNSMAGGLCSWQAPCQHTQPSMGQAGSHTAPSQPSKVQRGGPAPPQHAGRKAPRGVRLHCSLAGETPWLQEPPGEGTHLTAGLRVPPGGRGGVGGVLELQHQPASFHLGILRGGEGGAELAATTPQGRDGERAGGS